jgi:hypothetical protein
MNPASKKEKNPGYGKSKTPGACPHSEHRARQPQNLFAGFGMSWARAISAFGLKSLQRSLRRARQGLQIGDT